MPSVRARLLFLAAVTAFHIANFVLLYIGFLPLPIAFLIFFDLVPVHAGVKARLGKFRPARSTQCLERTREEFLPRSLVHPQAF